MKKEHKRKKNITPERGGKHNITGGETSIKHKPSLFSIHAEPARHV